MMLRRTRPHQVPAPLIALDQSLREAPVDERREADTLARARETLRNRATVQSEQIEWLFSRSVRVWYMWCPRCGDEGPKRVRYSRAKADRDAHHCTAGKP